MPSKRLFDRIDSIQLRGVTKKYDDRFAINDVSIDIEGGELVIFIGPSGVREDHNTPYDQSFDRTRFRDYSHQ